MESLREELLVVTKSMEKLVRESMKRDNKIMELERIVSSYRADIRSMEDEIGGLRQEINVLQQSLNRAQNKLDLVEYENAHESHLDHFMQEEAVKDATDFMMTPTDIARGTANYHSEREKHGMRRVGQ